MKKSSLLILTSVIILASMFSMIEFIHKHCNRITANIDKPVVEAVKLENIKWGNNVKVDADYADYSISFEDMKNKAVIVVEAKVVDQIQYSGMSVLSTLKIEKSLKGKEFDKVHLFQLRDSDVLKAGQKYILFLGKQTDDKEDTFFVIGGDQGIINITDNIIDANDPVVKKELDKYKSEKDSLTQLEQEIKK